MEPPPFPPPIIEQAPAPRWTVAVDPLTVALGFAHVQIERAIGWRYSLYVGPSLRLFDGILPAANGPYIGLGVEAGMRWFPWARAPEGPWVMLRGVGAYLRTTDGTGHERPGVYTSLLVGGTVIVDRWLVLSGGLGVSFFRYAVDGYGVSGFIPAAHTAIGVAF